MDYLIFESFIAQERYPIDGYGVQMSCDLIVNWMKDHQPMFAMIDRQIILKHPVIAAVVDLWAIPYHICEGVIRVLSVRIGTMATDAWLAI